MVLKVPQSNPRLRSERSKKQFDQMSRLIFDEIIPLESLLNTESQDFTSGMVIEPAMEQLRERARALGLWNLFITYSNDEGRLTNLEYAIFAEAMGRSLLAAEVFNCDAPDSGNIELLQRFGTGSFQQYYRDRLLTGTCRSSFAMTEPHTAGSDPRGIESQLSESNGEFRLNGTKWFVSGILHPKCEVILLFARDSAAEYGKDAFSILLVPRDSPGIEVLRDIPIFGYRARGGHCEVRFNDVELTAKNIIGQRGNGFSMAQSRLGPGRIHHAMRCVGMAERGLELMVERALERKVRGAALATKGPVRSWIAESRILLDQARELVIATASAIDDGDLGRAKVLTSMIKVVAPRTASFVLDRAIQLYGSHGLSDDFPLARMWSRARSLHFGDGPDEVHLDLITRAELAKVQLSSGA